MRTIYDASLKATVTLDDSGQIRGINHLDEYREVEHLPRSRGRSSIRPQHRRKARHRPGSAAQHRSARVVPRSSATGRRVPLQRGEGIVRLGHLRLLPNISQHSCLGGRHHRH